MCKEFRQHSHVLSTVKYGNPFHKNLTITKTQPARVYFAGSKVLVKNSLKELENQKG